MVARRLFLSLLLTCLGQPSFALIMGSDSDKPLEIAGWPDGAAEIFNIRQRVAYWEGPPFGGGQYHAECRGDTDTLNDVLAKFAKVDCDNKRIVVDDGVGRSFWLNPNDEPEKRNKARIDWRLMVWVEDNWKRLPDMPAGINPIDPTEKKLGPPCEITIYTGGNIDWSKVNLPEGVPVDDNRMEAHGYGPEDGVVIQGNLVDVDSGSPLAGRVVLQQIDPRKTGGYDYTNSAKAAVDQGHWVLKNVPPGWYRVIASSDGYLPRVVGYVKHDGQPSWREFECLLAKGGTLIGRVLDADGDPLEGVRVRLSDTAPAGGARYDSPESFETNTDECGEFAITAPVGTASIRIHKPGWCQPGLGPEIAVPTSDVELEMVRSSNITAIVLFQGTDVPDKYMVELEPEGGSAVGKWSGSANINEQNQFIFKDVPPGRYQLWGHPNPYTEREKTEPMLLDLKGGETVVKTIVVVE